MYKKLYLTGVVVYIALMAMSVLFYMERIVFLDMAFAIFHMAKDGDFAIQVYRFGDAFSRILPLAAVKAVMSLKAVCMGYSIGLTAFSAGCYIVCGTFFRQYHLALVVLLVNILFATDTFYWPQVQVPQGIGLMMVSLSVIRGRELKSLRIHTVIILMALLITIVFFHPLMTVAFAYTLVFLALYTGADYSISKQTLKIIALLFAAIFIIKMLFFRVPYERHSLSGLKNFIRLFPHYFNTATNRKFLADCLTKYYWIPATFLLIAIKYAAIREYKKLLLFTAAVVGYIMLVNTCYPFNDTPSFYLDALYLPLGLFLALPLLFDVLPRIRSHYAAIFMLLIMTTGCYRIYDAHNLYTARLNWERDFLKKHGQHKMIADSHKANAGILQMLWGTPYEFWLLSTIETGTSASVIIDDTPAHRLWADTKNKALIVNWNVFPYEDLNPLYFRFKDTTTSYLIDPPL